MRLTVKQLQEMGACAQGLTWFRKKKSRSVAVLARSTVRAGRFDWAWWVLVRLMTHPQKVQWVVFAAREVLDIFEQRWPGDMRPRLAIEAAEAFLAGTGTASSAASTASAGYAAYAAASAAYAADARRRMERTLIERALRMIGAAS